jgi:selenocysteine lyase/cysteine desulfurase
MSFDRRAFLGGLAASAGALLPFRAEARAEPAAAGPGAPLRDAAGAVDWRAVRAQFALDPDWIHLGSFFLVSHPRPVRAEIERWRDRLDANPLLLEAMFQPGLDNPLDAVKAALADYVGGRPEELALVPNTTTGLALVYAGLRIRPDQEILTTEHDHYSHHESIRRAAEKAGARVRFVALHEMPRGSSSAGADELVARLEKAIRPETRAVGVTWVHSSTGLELPVAEVARAVARANAGRAEADRCLLIVDGVHGFGAEDVDAAALGADFFVAGAHKWLFGPRGTGFVWGRAESWRELRPTVPTFDLDDPALWDSWVGRTPPPATRASHLSPGGFLAYEHLFSVPAAVEFHRAVGRDRIAERIRDLNRTFRAELASTPGVTVHTPQDSALAAGIVAFEVAGLEPEAVVERLRERRIHATTSPYAVSFARVAAGIMNTPEEIETTLAALRALAKAA